MKSGFVVSLLSVVPAEPVGRSGVAVECGTAAPPTAGIAIGAAARAKVGMPGTPPNGAEAFVVLWSGRGGVWVLGGMGIPVGLGGVPMMRIGFASGCWCGVGMITRSRYESSSRLRSSRSWACSWRKVSP